MIQYANRLTIKTESGKRWVMDPIRQKYVVLTPEELVRQLLVQYLVHEKGYRLARLAVEKSLQIHGRARRFDLLAYDAHHHPCLLAECKAFEAPIHQEVFDQVSRYNIALQVPYLVVTNGQELYACAIDYERQSWRFLPELPPYPEFSP